jgi:xanthine dehydrogenase accessory factor
VLGPRLRTETILRNIGAENVQSVFGPVGLDLAAEGAHQIAISIVSELLALAARREPRHLARRKEAIHAD